PRDAPLADGLVPSPAPAGLAEGGSRPMNVRSGPLPTGTPRAPDGVAAVEGQTAPERPSLPLALLRLARPKQWSKNVLVFAAPGAAGVLNTRGPFLDALIAFASFCLASAGTYYVNDAR